MAQQLTPVSLIGPGFLGINTEDSPISDNYQFAIDATNAVIDRFGRLSARKGINTLTSSGLTGLAGEEIESVGLYNSDAGNHDILSAGNGIIMKGTTTLTTLTDASWFSTYSPYAITENRWRYHNFRGQTFMLQDGYEPLVYDETNGLVPLSSQTGYAAPTDGLSAISTGVGMAAYGRMWIAGGSIVYWSDLKDGVDFLNGTAGSIDIIEYFPNGSDTIQSIQAHNGFLIIFGKESIVVYSGADGDPASNLTLVDTVAGVGFVSDFTVSSTGSDLVYLSDKGLKSFGRTIQEKSMPIEDLGRHMMSDIQTSLVDEQAGTLDLINGLYVPKENFYLLNFGGQNITYCFDTRQKAEDGAYRVTTWSSALPKCFCLDQNGDLIFGTVNGIASYSGYNDDDTDTYELSYTSPWLSFGDRQRLKFLKQAKPVVYVQGSPVFRTKWAYDLSTQYKSNSKDLAGLTTGGAEWGTAEWNEDEFSAGISLVTFKVNTNGSGSLIQLNCGVTVDGGEVSFQSIQLLALMGKTL